MAEKKQEKESENQKKSTSTFWEWVVAAVGLILVVAAIGTTLSNAWTEQNQPPKLEVVVDSIEPNGSNYLVKFSVKNDGGTTAAAVTIEGELKKGAEEVETANATLTYAPSHSERRGGLYFTQNPQQFEMNIRVTGYEEP